MMLFRNMVCLTLALAYSKKSCNCLNQSSTSYCPLI
jgi:hypothetical protein